MNTKPGCSEAFFAAVRSAGNDCAKCGACQSSCPVYTALHREGVSTRGRLHLLAAFERGAFRSPEEERELARVVEHCMLCGRCSVICPNKVPGMETCKSARAFFAARGVCGSSTRGAPLLRRLLLKAMLPRPALFRSFLAAGAVGKPVLDVLLRRFSGLALRFPALRGAERLPAVSRTSHLTRYADEVPGPAGAPRIAFFSGCVTSWMRPGLVRAAVKTLSRRFTVVIPKDQGCCGLPAISGGFPEAARLLTAANIQVLEAARADVVVTPCASCAHTLAHELEAGAPEPLKPAASRLSASVTELSLFLAENPALCIPRSAGTGKAVFAHVPCHLKVGFGSAEEPRLAIRLAGFEPVCEGGEQCCGGGALAPQVTPQLSECVFAKVRDAFDVRSPGILATECNGCFVQWTRLLPGIRAVHPVELLG